MEGRVWKGGGRSEMQEEGRGEERRSVVKSCVYMIRGFHMCSFLYEQMERPLTSFSFGWKRQYSFFFVWRLGVTVLLHIGVSSVV